MTDVWISAAGLCGTTVVGALLGLIIRDLPHKWNDIILGYCAGIMPQRIHQLLRGHRCIAFFTHKI